MDADIYCDACIIILYMQIICITPLLLYAMKYVNVVLRKSVDIIYRLNIIIVKLNFPPKETLL